jgi:hypothetical protein
MPNKKAGPAKQAAKKKDQEINNLPYLEDVVDAFHSHRIEYECHYPTTDTAVVSHTKSLNTEQLRVIAGLGGALGADMVVRIVCQNPST